MRPGADLPAALNPDLLSCPLSDAEQAAEATLRCADLLRKRTGSSCPRRSAGSTGKIVELLTRLDPSLIGGFVIQLGDMTYDKACAACSEDSKIPEREVMALNGNPEERSYPY